jgi:protein kinase C substrate 80K-H
MRVDYALSDKRNLALYQSLLKHSEALKSLQGQYKQLLDREKALSEVLKNLKQGYNPNYQDMAVLEAVRGWDGLNPEKTEEGE